MIVRNLLAVVVGLVLAASVLAKGSPKPAPSPIATFAPSPKPSPTSTSGFGHKVPRPQVDRGWLPEYSEHIRETVRQFPALLSIPQSEMATFCPGWERMSASQRTEFYVDLTYAITGPESSYNRLSMYWEKGQGTDSVTGLKKMSEGLLQLSMSDPKNYMEFDKRAYQYCPFDWQKDKEVYIKDVEAYFAGDKEGTPGRTLLDAYNNLSCGIFIYNLTLTKLRPITSSKFDFVSSLGGYWRVLQRDSEGYPRVRRELVKRQATCNVP